jgi:hypothetical protein
VGYQYSDTRFGVEDRRWRYHLIDAGVDYAKSLSFSRRTQLAFSTGTAASSSVGDDPRTNFIFTGNATLLHEIGRTWSAALAYQRGVYFAPQWQEPVMVDGASFAVGGLLSRRTRFQTGVGVSNGNFGVTGFGPRYRAYYAVSSLDYGLSRYLSIGTTYGYYSHVFGADAVPNPGFPNSIGRHTARVHLSAWAPLYQRGRRGNATR